MYIGHKAYRGFLYVEHTYNNIIANTFVALLSEESEQMKNSPPFQGKISDNHLNARFAHKDLSKHFCPPTHFNSNITDPVQSRRIRNRWLVAYTLIHNPSLRPLRVSQQPVQEQQSQEEKEAMAGHSQKEEAIAEGNVYEEAF